MLTLNANYPETGSGAATVGYSEIWDPMGDKRGQAQRENRVFIRGKPGASVAPNVVRRFVDPGLDADGARRSREERILNSFFPLGGWQNCVAGRVTKKSAIFDVHGAGVDTSAFTISFPVYIFARRHSSFFLSYELLPETSPAAYRKFTIPLISVRVPHFTKMATAVPSRFAVLSIEDDDYKPKKAQKNVAANKTSQKGKGDKPKQQQQQQPKKDDKKKQNKGKKKKINNEEQQWEQWKQKDSMAVEETFEQELHQAILLSKLAYEEQLVSASKPEGDQERNKKSGKKSKKATMSLEEFNNMGTNTAQTVVLPTECGDSKLKEIDPEFFERVEKEVKEEITKGKEKDILKARLNKIDNEITSAQLRVEVEKRDGIISQLRTEVETLKEELTQVKKRNKKLYQILSHGEMKDKASVLAEVAKLQEIRDELTSEVTSLHAQLEQERSKTRISSADVKPSKQTNKKRPASENA
ncbi:hypothetical protein KM043_013602 [Ampulex compressa]|nr:hypothetical protein KM043_013602 [Ampulex compressa]